VTAQSVVTLGNTIRVRRILSNQGLKLSSMKSSPTRNK
jgi:hypothetical protein